jgi:hypothetical protein
MSVAMVLALVAGMVGMSGAVTTILNFDPDSPWFGLGLLALGLAAVSGLTAYVVSHRTKHHRGVRRRVPGRREEGHSPGRPTVVRLKDRQRTR